MSWRCFHCDVVLKTEPEARHHFGPTEDCVPVCQVAAETYRKMEREVESYRNEADPSSRAFYELGAKHAGELRREEEKGFERGLAFSVGRQQARVSDWLVECFGEEVAADKLERGDRFLEEALELLQSGDYPRERVAALVDYVWGRPKGEPGQEVGGVGVTLLAYCRAHGIHAEDELLREVDRITQPDVMERIRAKQAAKPKGSALPVGPSEQDFPSERFND